MKEDYTKDKIEIKLTKEEINRMLNGEILEDYKTRIGLEFEE